MKKQRVLVIAASLAAAFFLFWEKGFLPGHPASSADKKFDYLTSVMRLIRNDYVEEKNPADTMDGALRGLINSLDATSGYLGKQSTQRYRKIKNSEPWDIGAVLFKNFGFFPQVLGVVEGSPAEKAGIKPGDTITEIDGAATNSLSLTEAALLLKDTAENPVRLKIIREEKTEEKIVPRVQLFPSAAIYAAQKDAAGILRILTLRPACASEIQEKFVPVIKGRKGPLILDLRNCSEGSTEEARSVINVFLKIDQAGYFERKGGQQDALLCQGNAPLAEVPLIIWTNRGTMGPAEIVAAALKEYRKAKIIGFSTAGMPSRNEYLALQDGSSLFLTTGIYYVKSGETPWTKGVSPDVKIELDEPDTAHYLQKTLGFISNQ